MCGCGGNLKKKPVVQAPASLPTVNQGTNQLLINQQREANRQQQQMQSQMIRPKKPIFR